MKAPIIKISILGISAALVISGVAFACNHDWNDKPDTSCTQGQFDKGDYNVDDNCVAPSPQPAPAPTPQPVAPTPQPTAPVPTPTASVNTFQGK